MITNRIIKALAAILIFIVFSTGAGPIIIGEVSSEKRVATGLLKNVTYSSHGNRDIVEITLFMYTDYSIMRLSSPERVVIDIYNAMAPGKQQLIKADGRVVKSIRYAQFDTYTARIVLDVNGQEEYGIEKTEAGLILFFGDAPDEATSPDESTDEDSAPEPIPIVDPDTKARKLGNNMLYHNSNDRVFLSIAGAELTSGDEFLKKLYTDKYEQLGKKYIMTFSSSRADISEGKYIINDKYLRSIEVQKNISKDTTSIIFSALSKFSYLTYSREYSDETGITILKPVSKASKLVVIDPGHGGRMPGAIYKGMYEKEINLDIAIRLKKLLLKKKVNTYMLRENDSDIDNYERAYIANKLNAALFCSIHNNALDDPNFGGTMTLHFPANSKSSRFSGRDFANIIQEKLLFYLKTTDRKLKERPNVVVLRATAMPSALAEIAFMTNSADRNNLNKDAFRQKAAQALCDAIIKSLGKL